LMAISADVATRTVADASTIAQADRWPKSAFTSVLSGAEV
jgi:hypothetical protein